MIRGKTSPQARSPFVDEIGPHNLDVQDLTTPDLTPARRTETSSGGFYADSDERSLIEAARARDLSLPPDYEYIRAGSSVRHAKFGVGKVVSMSSAVAGDASSHQVSRVGRPRRSYSQWPRSNWWGEARDSQWLNQLMTGARHDE